jgi:hypothetical protein
LDFLTQLSGLHVLVIGAAAAFGRDPVNDLVRILDVTGFAMDTIGRIDLQLSAVTLSDHFINLCRAEPRARIIVFLGAAGGADFRFENFQVDRLILIMFRCGKIDLGKPVARRQVTIHPFAVGWGVIVQFFQ